MLNKPPRDFSIRVPRGFLLGIEKCFKGYVTYFFVQFLVVVVEHAMCCVISSGPEPKPEFKGDERTFRLWLDTNQYQQDMAETVHGSEVDSLVLTYVDITLVVEILLIACSEVYKGTESWFT